VVPFGTEDGADEVHAQCTHGTCIVPIAICGIRVDPGDAIAEHITAVRRAATLEPEIGRAVYEANEDAVG